MFALVMVIVAAVVGIIAGLVALFSEKESEAKGPALGVAVVSVLAVISIWVGGSIAVIPNGHIAVMTRFQKVTGQVLQQGLNWKALIDTPVKMSIQTQLFSDDATAASKDLQDVTATMAINYRLNTQDAPNVYKTIGLNYITVVGHPIVQETVKEVTARYNAEDMILRRADVKADMADEITNKLLERGIVVEAVNITNFSFSDVFDQAIEAKVVAVQKVLEAENKLRQIEVEARQAEQKAKGEGDAIIALAERQARANSLLNDSLTPGLLQYMFIQQIKNTDKVITVPNGMTLALPTP